MSAVAKFDKIMRKSVEKWQTLFIQFYPQFEISWSGMIWWQNVLLMLRCCTTCGILVMILSPRFKKGDKYNCCTSINISRLAHMIGLFKEGYILSDLIAHKHCLFSTNQNQFWNIFLAFKDHHPLPSGRWGFFRLRMRLHWGRQASVHFPGGGLAHLPCCQQRTACPGWSPPQCSPASQLCLTRSWCSWFFHQAGESVQFLCRHHQVRFLHLSSCSIVSHGIFSSGRDWNHWRLS